MFVSRGELVGHTEYHGRDGIRRAMDEVLESWAEIKPAAREVTAVDEDVLVATIRFQLRSHNEVELEIDEYWAYWMRDGRLARIEQHGTLEEALSACGRGRSR